MNKVPKEIVAAVNGLLAPYGESYSSSTGQTNRGYCSTQEAIRYLGVSKSFFYNLVRTGVIKGVKLNKDASNGKVVFAWEELERYIESCRSA